MYIVQNAATENENYQSLLNKMFPIYFLKKKTKPGTHGCIKYIKEFHSKKKKIHRMYIRSIIEFHIRKTQTILIKKIIKHNMDSYMMLPIIN